jgi:hypothetical protein
MNAHPSAITPTTTKTVRVPKLTLMLRLPPETASAVVAELSTLRVRALIGSLET